MDEPLLGRGPLVAQFDPLSRLVVVHARATASTGLPGRCDTRHPGAPVPLVAGPAGSAGIDLGGGIQVDVDVARPASLAGLVVELPSGGDPGALPPSLRQRLAVLLGADRTARLASVLRQRSNEQDPVLRALDDGREGGPGDDGRDGEGGDDGDPVIHGRHRAGGPARAVAPRRRGHRPSLGRGPGRAEVNGRRPHDVSTGVAPALHRAAMALANACQPGALPIVRAVGLLEASVEHDQISHLLDVRFSVRHHARAGAELMVAAVSDGPLTVPDPHTAAELASVLRRASRLVAGTSPPTGQLLELADELSRSDHVVQPPPAPADAGDAVPDPLGPLNAAWRSSDRRVAVDTRSLPGALGEAVVTARRAGVSEVEVRIADWGLRRGGLRARGFDGADDTLLAVKPFRRDGHDAVARLFVAPEAIRRLEVDVTDRPEAPRPSPTLAAVQRAIHLGVVASRYERLGDPGRAAYRWRQCARSWDGAGDPDRAGQARACAAEAATVDPQPFGRAIRPLVSDLVTGDA